eukprot:10351388-Alexandrium_andersonii.AAC.1
MSASLVGSEMCIRDRTDRWRQTETDRDTQTDRQTDGQTDRRTDGRTDSCLLYTSDAADDM